MSEHRPECIYTPQHFDPEQNIVWGGKPCICDEIKQAESRLLSEVFLVLKDIPDEMWIAKNSDQAFNVKWYVIEKVDEIWAKP